MYWQRRDDRIFVFEKVNGKIKSVPRAMTRHLDGRTDEEIDRYVDSIRPKKTIERPIMDHHLDDLVARFLSYHRNRGMNPSTLEMKRYSLLMHVAPYFLSLDPPRKDPNDWPQHSIAMLPYLEKSCTPHLISRANTALRQFWKWLQDEGLVSLLTDIRLRTPVFKPTVTPLQFTLTPEAVIEFARQAEPDFAFLALAGYFCSLRTQEVLALTRRDFAAGTIASQLECCKVMKQHDLFDRFAVNVTKQNSKSLNDNKAPPKNGSKGWVACFNGEAAKMLIQLIKILGETSEDRPLVKFGIDYNMKRWATNGVPGITLKDLRRASLYWLGHYSKLGFIEIRNHARHSDQRTTLKYLRRPEETIQEMYDLDLDA